jgi:flagella basal body P-ring formation protein FlgA
MKTLAALALMLAAGAAAADTVVATRTIRPQEIITADALRLDAATVAGAHDSLEAVIGQEARVAIYPGRAVMRNATGMPALIERNAVVELVYRQNGLVIVTEGRALARAAAGERIRVMNLSSRTTLFGTVSSNGTVLVTK